VIPSSRRPRPTCSGAWTDPLRLVVACLGLALAGACAPTEPPQPPDSLSVQVFGLPNAEHGKSDPIETSIRIVGPGGFDESVLGTTLLTERSSGSYRVAADDAMFGVTAFEPRVASTTVTLTAGGSVRVPITYAPHRSYARAAIAHLNAHRLAAGVAAVTLDEDASMPQWLHARYAAVNRTWGHDEDPTLPWFTPEGRAAARSSNLAYAGGITIAGDARWSIESWAQAPFHFASMLDPRTTHVRFGVHAHAHPCGQALDAPAELSAFFEFQPADAHPEACTLFRSVGALQTLRSGVWPPGKEVLFPAPDMVLDSGTFLGEWPSPAAHTTCAPFTGAGGRLGFPILAMFGPQTDPIVISSRFERAGSALPHCVFTGATYANPVAQEQQLGRSILSAHGGIVLVPAEPLTSASVYTVTLTTNRGVSSWSFRTADVLRDGPLPP
jgi:hypothetical protein